MNPGEVHLANFPFGDTPGMKLRPVLFRLSDHLGRPSRLPSAFG